MSKIEYDPDTYDRLFKELSARLIEEDTGTVVTALTVLLGNAGYWHSMDFDQFMELLANKNTPLTQNTLAKIKAQ